MSEAALCAYEAPRVDVLIHYLVDDEPDPARWQSGVVHRRRPCEAGAAVASLPVHGAVARTGRRTTLWGQVRPADAATYRLLRFDDGKLGAVGGADLHDARAGI